MTLETFENSIATIHVQRQRPCDANVREIATMKEKGAKRARSPLIAVLLAIATALELGIIGCSPAWTQAVSPQNAPPQQVEHLLKLLRDPEVRQWVEDQQRIRIRPEVKAPPSASELMTERISRLREHFAGLAGVLPRLPDEFRNARKRLREELDGRSGLALLGLVLGFLALGAGAEFLFRIVAGSFSERSEFLGIGVRLAPDLGSILIFTLGSLGAFLVFDWPPVLRRIVVAYLLAAVLLRSVLLAGRFLLAPALKSHEEEQFRFLAISTPDARFWYRRLALFVGWFAFGWATVDMLSALGFSRESRALVAYSLGLGLLAICLEAVWTRYAAGRHRLERRRDALWASLLSFCFILLWALWVAGAMRLFWLGVVALALPALMTIAKQAAHHALHRRGGPQARADMDLRPVYADWAIRALLIGGAVLFLAYAWDIDLIEVTTRDSLATRLARGALSSVVILLVADLIWQTVKTLIDWRMAGLTSPTPSGSEEALRKTRLRTLLPIVRYATLAMVAVVAALMVLAQLGIQIGPLIAGAGIAGIAIGFGAQTLVRDIISGIFYLLDDAFRVGEYIQSGKYKGTVESLGFRSLKLRHHRGPIYIVPYGQLGAVENMSRDWVIDKITVNVTYDTDLGKAKAIIKQIGKELAQDPEIAPQLLETLKMQGVEQFGDFAIELRLKMTTRPGEQFVIRRKAYGLLKKAFDENGIRFGFLQGPMGALAGREAASSRSGK